LLQKHSNYKIDELWICFEMHGFLLANTEGNPITGYISWKDQRATYDAKENSQSTLDSLKNKLIATKKLKVGSKVIGL
jgi:sugar (pentulose or hexulose) kinase